VKIGLFLGELREALTMPTKGSLLKAVLLLAAIVVVAVGLSYVLHVVLPEEELKRFAQYGYSGVFLVTLVSSLSIVLPLPGTVVVVAAAEIWNTPLIALVASIGGALGEISGYALGYWGRAVVGPEQTDKYRLAQRWMQRHGGVAIFLFALVPFFIFDFVGIAAGVLRYPLRRFLLFAWMGRLPRSMIECYLGASLIEAILDHLPF